MEQAIKVDFAQIVQAEIDRLSDETKRILQQKQTPAVGVPQKEDTTEQKENERVRKKVEDNSKKQVDETKKLQDQMRSGYGEGASAGSSVEQELNELKGGRFFGMFEKGFSAVKSLKDKTDNMLGINQKQNFQPSYPSEPIEDKPTTPKTILSAEESAKKQKVKQKKQESIKDIEQEQDQGLQDVKQTSNKEVANQEREKFSGLKNIIKDTNQKLYSGDSSVKTLDKTLFGQTQPEPVNNQYQMSPPGFGSDKELRVDNARFDKVEIGKVVKGGIFGGKEDKFFGKGSGDSGSGSSGGMGMAGKVGGTIAVVAAVAGFGLKLMSDLAGMYQQAYQKQDKTLDATGGYVGSGGALTSNAEMAQIGVSRAKILGGTAREQVAGDKLGVRFGLTQGIGGSQGAEMFAKLAKFGGMKEDRGDVAEVLAYGVKAGFAGLRQSEMFQRVAGMSEQSYQAGYGKSNIKDIVSTVAAVSGKGIDSDRSMSIIENLQGAFQKDGGLMQNLAVAEYMNQGMGYVEALAKAQDPANMKGNLDIVNKQLGALDGETKSLIMIKEGIHTAGEAVKARDKTGKMDVLGNMEYGLSASDKAGGSKDLSKMLKAGQQHRATENRIDNMIVGSTVAQKAHMAQVDITNATLKFMEGADKDAGNIINKVSSGDYMGAAKETGNILTKSGGTDLYSRVKDFALDSSGVLGMVRKGREVKEKWDSKKEVGFAEGALDIAKVGFAGVSGIGNAIFNQFNRGGSPQGQTDKEQKEIPKKLDKQTQLAEKQIKLDESRTDYFKEATKFYRKQNSDQGYADLRP